MFEFPATASPLAKPPGGPEVLLHDDQLPPCRRVAIKFVNETAKTQT